MAFRIVSLWASLKASQRLTDQKITTKNPDFQIGTPFALAITMPKHPKNIFIIR